MLEPFAANVCWNHRTTTGATMDQPIIICVDAAPTALAALKSDLQQTLNDCWIETVERGATALQLLQTLQRQGHEVALVLTRYGLPDLKGDELLKQVQSLSPDTLNILVGSDAPPEAIAHALRYGGLYRYIPSTWSLEDLQATVTEAMQSYWQRRQLARHRRKLQGGNRELEPLVATLQQAEQILRQVQGDQLSLRGNCLAPLNRVVQSIRNSLDLNTILSTAAIEVSQLLATDRTSVVHYLPERQVWLNVANFCRNPAMGSSLHLEIPDQGNPLAARLKRLEIVRIDDVQTCADEINRELARRYPGSWLLVPIDMDGSIWGSLSLVRSQTGLGWQDWEVELVQAVVDQLAIAIQQSQLYQQVQQFNAQLEQQVQERTAELQTALDFEALLKRITDKVRDSMDEAQILQTAVQELALELDLSCCDAALYDLEKGTSTICYESIRFQVLPAVGSVIPLNHRPDIHQQLLRGQWVQCCLLEPQLSVDRNMKEQTSILICPLIDEQGVFGDLWLFKPQQDYFSEMEIRLVQQVANQCAIALRQSRLYQIAQSQVQELQRLSHLKDDFLSTVSHELRSPMTNMAMAIQMLELMVLPLPPSGTTGNAAHRYFQILKDECQRETNLINDLLDLARLEAETDPLIVTTTNLRGWLPQVVEPFLERIHKQQQVFTLDLPAELPLITTDLSYLQRIMTELLHNACKYTPLQACIVISVEPLPAGFQIQVKNSGVEIPPAERGRIFDKFYRIPNSDPWKHGGTGLGLALVKKQIEQLQGTIDLLCQPDWTVFSIQLPNLPPPLET